MFRDRTEAGQRLADALAGRQADRTLVLALPRGGLPVAEPVARSLGADLDVLVVRKVGAPGNPEFAMGAIGQDGAVVLDHELVRRLGLSPDEVESRIATERRELDRRVGLYRAGRPPLDVAGRPVIIVDDGLATGSTAAAAVAVVRHLGAGHVTVAVPVGSQQAVAWLRTLADEVVCLSTPEWFRAVGEHYASFDQVTDEEVIAVLALLARSTGPVDTEVAVDGPGIRLPGHLTVPRSAVGMVLFAHGSGSSRHSPRNIAVARALNARGLGTLLLDLLTDREAQDRELVFDIPLLAERVGLAVPWTRRRAECRGLPVGLFGASTGAAAALVAAAGRPDEVAAVVSRGGRPDLAGPWLPRVQAPTLLIVGGADHEVLELNRAAQRQMTCMSDLAVVPGATHLFEEPGTLDAVAGLAGDWFVRHLAR